jgi:hypothetical protein
MKVRKNRKGQLLIEFSVAIAVAITALSATLAQVQSTSKTGREIELMNKLVTDVSTFTEYDNNVHLMGGPNFVTLSNNTGDLSTEYGVWLQTVNQFNNLAVTPASNPVVGGTCGSFFGFIWQNVAIGSASAINHPNAPGAAGQLWFVSGNSVNTTGMDTTVCYVHVQGPLVTAEGTSTPVSSYADIATLAADKPVVAPAAPAFGVQNASTLTMSEAAQISLVEDPNTGIVAVGGAFSFGAVTLTAAGTGAPIFLVAGGAQATAPAAFAAANNGFNADLSPSVSGTTNDGF